jgi:two-component system, cell cycle response regulator
MASAGRFVSNQSLRPIPHMPERKFDNQSQPKVLVIDDSEDVHRLLRMQLKHEDLVLVAASSGEDGLLLAQEVKPAIILLDLDMPGLNGFELLARLKSDDELMQVPVIVLSGMTSPQDKVAAFDLGAVDYITKPFNLTELRVRVRCALRMYLMVQMLAQRAHIDGLTGLWNRAYFNKRWLEEVAASVRHGRPLSLAMLDVDKFKAINDEFGHPAGDLVLQGLAKLLTRLTRLEDVACRYGGEEFAIIIPETGPEEAMILCRRIAQAAGETLWADLGNRAVTFSIGLTGSHCPSGIAAAEWLAVTDQHLYRAKTSGRNQIVTGELPGCQVSS